MTIFVNPNYLEKERLSYKSKCLIIREIIDDDISNIEKLNFIDIVLKTEFEKLSKSERNYIYYSFHSKEIINSVREWERKNPEKRKEYTRRYYATERGKAKKREQNRRRRERMKNK